TAGAYRLHNHDGHQQQPEDGPANHQHKSGEEDRAENINRVTNLRIDALRDQLPGLSADRERPAELPACGYDSADPGYDEGCADIALQVPGAGQREHQPKDDSNGGDLYGSKEVEGSAFHRAYSSRFDLSDYLIQSFLIQSAPGAPRE